MPTGRSYTLEEIKKMLKTRMSEYEMLNKTYVEMLERNSNKESIREVENAMKDAIDNVKVLQDWIEEWSTKPNLYGNITKKVAKTIDMKTGNLYDNIKKEEKKDLNSLSDFKPYDTPYNHLNYEEIYKKKEEEKNNEKKLIFLRTETNETFLRGIITNSNCFLVRFNGGLNIKEWLVKGVDFEPTDTKKLTITIQDHLAEVEDGKKYPIISELIGKNTPYAPSFMLSIDYLDPTGVVLYTERYHGCRIVEVSRGNSLSYEMDSFNTIRFTVKYTDVTYETAH